MDIIDKLLKSDVPAIRYKMLVNILGENPDLPGVRKARTAIKKSPRVQLLLSEQEKNGRIPYRSCRK
jgi:hypothetical protein